MLITVKILTKASDLKYWRNLFFLVHKSRKKLNLQKETTFVLLRGFKLIIPYEFNVRCVDKQNSPPQKNSTTVSQSVIRLSTQPTQTRRQACFFQPSEVASELYLNICFLHKFSAEPGRHTETK